MGKIKMKDTKNLIRQAGLLAATMALMATARDASAIERKGFIAGLGIGGVPAEKELHD